MSLDINEAGSDDAYLCGHLILKLGVDYLIRVPIERQDRHTPPKSSKIPSVLERPQHPAAAALRRIVVCDEESMSHPFTSPAPPREASCLVLFATFMDNGPMSFRASPV